MKTVLVLATVVAVALANTVSAIKNLANVKSDDVKQQDLLLILFFHPHEPLQLPEQIDIAQTWDLTKNINKYNNATAVTMSTALIKKGWVLPNGIPFSVLEAKHRWQAVTFFNLLRSAKTYETFYKTAVYLRDNINEHMFVYVLTTAIYQRQDTRGVVVPPLYEIFPSFFNNGEIMTTAQRVAIYGSRMIKPSPSTYTLDNNVVIRWNATVWPYYSYNKETSVAYFTHDYGLNNFYYNRHVLYPFWLESKSGPLVKDRRRGEWFWFIHKQLLARYYMERLSNGLGEIPELGLDIVEQGYSSGLLYDSGIAYPVRPSYLQLQQPQLVEEINDIIDYERRIRDAIDAGYFVTPTGEHVSIQCPNAIDVLGRLIESNVDSPNKKFYGDFISIWKTLLGNSALQKKFYWKGVPWVLPSVLEQFQTTQRDPAFYMIWKRVLQMFTTWQEKLPPYTKEELSLTGVEIEKVEVDELVTYFEYTYMNVTNHPYLNEDETKRLVDTKRVVVQQPRLNHKLFSVRVSVKSDTITNVVVRLFLASKYNSYGNEIPLELNSENSFQFDQFTTTLKKGENVFSHSSNESQFFMNDYTSSFLVFDNTTRALEINEQTAEIDRFPQRLLLPKGRVGGMPYIVMVHIAKFHDPNVLYGTGFNPCSSLGVGLGTRRMASEALGFPLDRPLNQYQVQDLKNIWFENVAIYHMNTPEVIVNNLE